MSEQGRDIYDRLRSLQKGDRVFSMSYKSACKEAADEIERLRAQLASATKALDWVESWVHNPVGSYSVAALDGLFAMTRDRIAELSLTDEKGQS